MSVFDLRERPQYVPVVADRIWHAWWKADGAALEDVETALADVLAAPGFPFTLVAEIDGAFAGTATAVASDLSERPNLGPWIAALWVEPDQRGKSIAETLVAAALARLAALGHGRVYLCAKPKMRDYYVKRGWALLEQHVGTDELDVFSGGLDANASLAPMSSP